MLVFGFCNLYKNCGPYVQMTHPSPIDTLFQRVTNSNSYWDWHWSCVSQGSEMLSVPGPTGPPNRPHSTTSSCSTILQPLATNDRLEEGDRAVSSPSVYWHLEAEALGDVLARRF